MVTNYPWLWFQNLLPINKRTQEVFENHFRNAGLEPIVDFQVSKGGFLLKRRPRQNELPSVPLMDLYPKEIRHGHSPSISF